MSKKYELLDQCLKDMPNLDPAGAKLLYNAFCEGMSGEKLAAFFQRFAFSSPEDMRQRISGLVSTLNERHAEVIRMRYGIDYPRTFTMEEIGKIYHVSRARIGQIEEDAYHKMMHPSKFRMLLSQEELQALKASQEEAERIRKAEDALRKECIHALSLSHKPLRELGLPGRSYRQLIQTSHCTVGQVFSVLNEDPEGFMKLPGVDRHICTDISLCCERYIQKELAKGPIAIPAVKPRMLFSGTDGIEALNLSVRSVNCLRSIGILDVQTLLSAVRNDPHRIRSIRNLGQQSFEEILTKCSLIELQEAAPKFKSFAEPVDLAEKTVFYSLSKMALRHGQLDDFLKLLPNLDPACAALLADAYFHSCGNKDLDFKAFFEDFGFSSLTDMQQRTAAVLDALPEREAHILKLRYGIGGVAIQTLDQIGQSMGLTKERIRQLEVKALRSVMQPSRWRLLFTPIEQLPMGCEAPRKAPLDCMISSADLRNHTPFGMGVSCGHQDPGSR